MSFETIIEWVLSTGPLGLLALVTAIAVLVSYVALRLYPKGHLVFAALALLPLMWGLVGTAIGYQVVDRHAQKHPDSSSQQEIELGRKQALRTTQLGGGLTAALLLVALAAFVARKPIEQDELVSPS